MFVHHSFHAPFWSPCHIKEHCCSSFVIRQLGELYWFISHSRKMEVVDHLDSFLERWFGHRFFNSGHSRALVGFANCGGALHLHHLVEIILSVVDRLLQILTCLMCVRVSVCPVKHTFLSQCLFLFRIRLFHSFSSYFWCS